MPPAGPSLAAFDLLQEDFRRLGQYVELHDANLSTFSHRFYELLLRTCTEFESLCKELLVYSGYSKKPREMNINDYKTLQGPWDFESKSVGVLRWMREQCYVDPFHKWSPAHSGNWILGASPTLILPDCGLTLYWPRQMAAWAQCGLGYLAKQFILGVFPQQWWSIGGEHGRLDTNQMNLQPIATLFFGEGWSIGYSGNILADWTAPSEDVWTVPVGLGLGKVVKLRASPRSIHRLGEQERGQFVNGATLKGPATLRGYSISKLACFYESGA